MYQHARAIGDNSRRAMLQQQHSIDPQVDSTACEAGGIAHSEIQFSLDSENLKDCCP